MTIKTETTITIRPGPVIHIFRDGQQVAELPLTVMKAHALASDLLGAVSSEDVAKLDEDETLRRVRQVTEPVPPYPTSMRNKWGPASESAQDEYARRAAKAEG